MIAKPSKAAHIGGSACGYQAIFVPSTALASPGYDGQPAVYLYIAALEVNVLNCRCPGGRGVVAPDVSAEAACAPLRKALPRKRLARLRRACLCRLMPQVGRAVALTVPHPVMPLG